MLTKSTILYALLTILGTGLTFGLADDASSQVERPLIKSCIENLCRESSTGAEVMKSYLAREKQDHAKLNQTFEHYQPLIDRARESRHKRMTSMLALIRTPDWLKKKLEETSDAELLELYLSVKPWNTDRVFKDGTLHIVAKSLRQEDTPATRLIADLFQRFLAVSPLFRKQAEFSVLHTDLKKVFPLKTGQSLKQYLKHEVERGISRLKSTAREHIQDELAKALIVLESSEVIYGPNASVYLAELDLHIRIHAGELTITTTEREQLIEIISDKITAASKRVASSDLNKIYSKSIWDQKCRVAFNRSLHYGLTDQAALAVDHIKLESLSRARRSIQELFGPAVAQRIDHFLTAVDIVGPLPLKSYFKMVDAYLALETSATMPTDVSDTYALLYDLQRDRDSKVDSICNSFIYQPLRDQEGNGLVILSSYSIANIEVGLSISLHELGHATMEGFKLLAKTGADIGEFMAIRQCLNLNYQTSTKLGDHLPNDKLWTEEDWADAFSGYATRDLNVIPDCKFLGAFPDHDYANLNERITDPHSPNFYRILNIYVHAHRHLPQQCSEALASEYPMTSLPVCLNRK